MFGLVIAAFPAFSEGDITSLLKWDDNGRTGNSYGTGNSHEDAWQKQILSEVEGTYNVQEGHYIKSVIKFNTQTSLGEDSEVDERSTIILSVVASNSSYGGENTFADFFNTTLTGFEYVYPQLSLGLLFTEEDEYYHVRSFLRDYFNDEDIASDQKFSKVTLLCAPFLKGNINRADRHSNAVQKYRRILIAKSRNFLINNALENERYTLSIDSDMVQVNPLTLDYFVDSGKDIIVPRIVTKAKGDYDYNSWQGERAQPSPEEYERIRNAQEKSIAENTPEEYIYVPHDKNMKHLSKLWDELREADPNTPENAAVEIDSVGGAILFVKSEVFKYGVQFPTYHVIGADWDLPLGGYDGIETEGLCYGSKMLGFKCWAMPALTATHTSG
ncbi:LADA_0E12530g1_1 [Lachancea dasiensis]|uniref:LADA_0E12530g1_1 n=1 Tax=Lachancea dasiensis TaxID=1072105 RepID=A0A1G4JF82_9SACH|nr:LADA_0E12530g1_1 [Lachancea dasiensis]